jgi:rhodanese-related sulfurtransferase
MVEEANRSVEMVSPEDVANSLGREGTVIVDIRDVRELQREGKIPNAFHCPRGMLEFWIDPESPYHKPVFAAPDTTFVFYCASGWRSALATKTAKDMGLETVKHIEGGFGAWKKAGLPVEPVERK